MIDTAPETVAAPQDYAPNSIGWLAAQLSLEVAEAITLVRQTHKQLPLTADANTIVPVEKVDRLLATKQGRDNVLKLDGTPQPATPGEAPQTKEGGGAIATERRLLNLKEIKTVAQMAGVTQKLVKSVDSVCYKREEDLHALLGFRREEGLIEAESTGRLIARLRHAENLNDELDDLELKLARSTSRASDLAESVFGVNLQDVINNLAEADNSRADARQEMTANFNKVQSGEGDRLGEDALIDPWAAVKHESSMLGAKHSSRLRRGVTS